MGQGLAASVVCMYVCHLFGMQLKIAQDTAMHATLCSKMWHRKTGGLGVLQVGGRTCTFVLEQQPEC